MIRVHVKPLCENECGGRLFQVAYPGAFHLLKTSAADIGVSFHSWEMEPIELADCVWVFDLPRTRSEIVSARKRARKGVPFILQIMESPAWNPHFFDVRNYELFDYIVTYQNDYEDTNVFKYKLPNDFKSFRCNHKEYHNRKCSVLINTNKVVGWLAVRQSGLVGLPGLGAFFSGWRRPWQSLFWQNKGELYSWRRGLARTAAARYPGALEVYGRGWKGERISWCPLNKNPHFPNYVSGEVKDKFELISNFKFTIAAENYRGSMGYVSEKIFDPLIAGSVPVYLGDEDIEDVVPREVFVDARKFLSYSHLMEYLVACPEWEWRKMYDAGREFMASEMVNEFSMEKFSEDMLRILKMILFKHKRL